MCVQITADTSNASDDIKYYVYNRLSAEHAYPIELNVESIVRSFYQAWKPTLISIHRLEGTQKSPENHAIITAKLQQEDCNVLVVDWSRVANSSSEDILATNAAVAASIADFLLFLHKHFAVQLSRIHLVGFSEGAHIAGLVGRNILKLTSQKVKRITGLDPAGGIFTTSMSAGHCLSAEAAEFVEIVHTNAGKLGLLAPIGHVDYYPNGGVQQPGCEVANADICAHERAYELVPEMWSERNEFLAQQCSTLVHINRDNCVWINVKMGEDAQVHGIYYVETNGGYPYGKGSFAYSFM
ncbi:lipoprotein lipase isoform X2 [Eurosta solidaginis]